MSEQPLHHSPLRRVILQELATHPIAHLSDFASSIGYSRPSVSRCLWKLRAKGVVQVDGSTWTLTEQGKQAAVESGPYHEMEQLTERMGALAERYHIPLVAAYEQEGYLRITKQHIRDCSEIACAYGELTGWTNYD